MAPMLRCILIFLCIAVYRTDDAGKETSLKFHMSGEFIWYMHEKEMQGLFQIDTDLVLNLSTVQQVTTGFKEINIYDFSNAQMYSYSTSQSDPTDKSCNTSHFDELQIYSIEDDIPFIAIAKLAKQPDLITEGKDTTFNNITAKMVQLVLRGNATANLSIKSYWKTNSEDDLRLLGFYLEEGDAKNPKYTVFDFILDVTKPGAFDPPTNLYCKERIYPTDFPKIGEIVGFTINSFQASVSNILSLDLKNAYVTLMSFDKNENFLTIRDGNSESSYETTSPGNCAINEMPNGQMFEEIALYKSIFFQNTSGVHYLGKKVVRNIPCSVYQVPMNISGDDLVVSWCIAKETRDPVSNIIPLIQVEWYENGEINFQENIALLQKERLLKIRTAQSLDISTCFEDLSEKLQFEIKVEKEDELFLLHPKVLEEFYSKLFHYAKLKTTYLRFTEPKITRSGERMFFQFTLLEHASKPFDKMTTGKIKDTLTNAINNGAFLISMPIDSKTIHFEAVNGSLKQQFQYSNPISVNTTIPTTDSTGSTTEEIEATTEVTNFTPEVTGSTPEVTGSTPQVTKITHEVTNITPEITDSTHEVTDSTREVTDSTPEVSGSTSEVTNITHEVTNITPEVTGSTPEVIDSTPEITGSTPEVTGSTPQVTKITHEATNITPEVTDSTHEVTDSTREVIDSTHEVTDSTPEVSCCTSEVTNITPEVTNITPEVTDSTPEITGFTPEITGSTPEVAGSTPEVTGSTPKVTGSTPEVTNITPKVTGSTPEVTNITPKVTGSTPDVTGVSRDSSTSTSGTTRIITPTNETPEIVHLLSRGTFGGVGAVMLVVGFLMGTVVTYVKMVYIKKRRY